MAFRSAPSVNVGAELAEINTEALGFSGIGGEKKVELLSTPWPRDQLPPSSASLLSATSDHGLLAAAGPDSLVVTSTDGVRKAFAGAATDEHIVTDFKPDLIISLAQPRSIAFSSDGDFLVVTAESGGGLAVYNTSDLLKKQQTPAVEISTDRIPVRALVPNPTIGQYFAAVLDSGGLLIVDVQSNKVLNVSTNGATCASWSLLGKAIVAGLDDGTASQYRPDGTLMATIPRPPNMDESYAVSGIYWLSRDVFLMAHSPRTSSSDGMQEESIYHIVKADRNRTSFSFEKAPYELLYPSMGPERNHPPRFSFTRLRDWKPSLEDMVIITASNSIDFALLTNTSEPIAPDQQVTGELTITAISQDNRKAQLPQIINDEEGGDSVLIGEALDLSSKNKVAKPIPMDDEFRESSSPLPAFFALNHQGLLCGWWIVYDKSIRTNTAYPGLVAGSHSQPSAPLTDAPQSVSQPSQQNQTSTAASPFGAPSTPNAGPTSSQISNSAFGKPAFEAISSQESSSPFGKPVFGGATQANASPFGKSAFGASNQAATSTFGKPSFGAPTQTGTPAFGKPSFGTATQAGTSTFGKPSFGTTTQSSASAFGKPAFGTQSPLGNNAAAKGASPSQNASPFSNTGGGFSGFASLGNAKPSTGGSAFSSFSSVGAGTGQSPFSSGGQANSAFSGLGQNKSVFAAGNNDSAAPKGLGSFGSTVTVGSREGSTLPPSWANTPAQQSGSIFGQGTSSFASSKESDGDDAQNRQRDEATPTPQAPPPRAEEHPKSVFGLGTNGFKLDSSFKGDGSAKNDSSKPAASSAGFSFASDFSSALGSQPPATPIKREEDEPRLQDIPTTPALPSKPNTLFPSATPKDSPAPEPSATPQKSPIAEDAPLPPDFTTWKAPKSSNDDLPPLAGSPAIKIEAPDSDVPSSPLEEDEDNNLSVEEQEDDDDGTEDGNGQGTSPLDANQRSRPPKSGWSFQDSVNQSPRIPPAAPTPPANKSGTSSRSGDEARTSNKTPSWNFAGVSAKPTPQALFPQAASGTPTGFPKPPAAFPPPSNRAQNNMRSPSPQRAASTSALGTRRQQQYPHGSALSSSIQQTSKPPTPQPALSDLSDDEDERIRRELASDNPPSRYLEDFIAHQDYTGAVSKTGTPGQIELLYRDMNSMVDTVGLNSRSLSSFVKYHKEPASKDRDDLDNVIDEGFEGAWYDQWRLDEINHLQRLEQELEQELDEGRIQNVLEKLGQLTRLLREKAKLLTKLNDIRRQILTRKDPQQAEAVRKASLPADLAEQQKTLRKDYAELLAQLGQAEERALLLKSKLSSSAATNGKPTAVPTVDAVKKTINRLIQMTETKNNDILLLEQRMRKLNVSHSRPGSSSSRTVGTPSRSTRKTGQNGESPLATPVNQSRLSLSELNRSVRTPEPDDTPSKGFGLYYTPEGSPAERGSQSLVTLADNIEGEKLTTLRATAKRRKAVAASLSDAVIKRGVKVTRPS